jgi:hypothetical protein
MSTILGKILVILNLVFSLVVGALIIMVFVTRTNWEACFNKLKDLYTVAEANSRQYLAEAQEAKAQAEGEVKKAHEELATLARDKDRLDKENKALTAENQDAKKRIEAATVNIQAATDEINRRKQEIDNLKAVTAEKDARMVQLETQNKQFRDEAVSADIASKAEHQRNVDLLNHMASLTKELEKRPTAGGAPSQAGVTAGKRPPDDLEGVVVKTEPRAGLITINLGSDAGLSKGNTLEVYRLKPSPRYLGMITILDANFKEAVARPVPPLRVDQVQANDIVASRITASKR